VRGALAALRVSALGGLVAVASLVAADGLAAQSAARDSAVIVLLEETAIAYRSPRTFRADFAQTLTNPRTGTVYASRGEFFQQGAERFAFRFSDPPDDRIIADGDVLWLYLPSTAKGQVLKVPRAAGGGMDLVAMVLRDPAQRFIITAGADTVVGTVRVRTIVLTPRTFQSAFTRGTLWVNAATALVRAAEFVEASGLVRRIEFSRIRLGEAMPTGTFTFVPPAGVRVIDQAALLGGTVPPAGP
jgi:outer membrane lipoprotein carrier protein